MPSLTQCSSTTAINRSSIYSTRTFSAGSPAPGRGREVRELHELRVAAVVRDRRASARSADRSNPCNRAGAAARLASYAAAPFFKGRTSPSSHTAIRRKNHRNLVYEELIQFCRRSVPHCSYHYYCYFASYPFNLHTFITVHPHGMKRIFSILRGREKCARCTHCARVETAGLRSSRKTHATHAKYAARATGATRATRATRAIHAPVCPTSAVGCVVSLPSAASSADRERPDRRATSSSRWGVSAAPALACGISSRRR